MQFLNRSLGQALSPAAVLLLFTTAARPSHAEQQKTSHDAGSAQAPNLANAKQADASWVFGAAALASTTGGGLAVDARFRWLSGVQLGALVSGQAASHAYFGGTKADGVASGAVSAVALFPLLTVRSIEFDCRISTGLGYARDVADDPTPHRDALRSVTELSWLALVPFDSGAMLRAGVTLAFELETKPTGALADQAQLLTLGFGQKLGDDTLLYATVDAGGTYGFDGDNGKVITRGALGLRWGWDGAAGAF